MSRVLDNIGKLQSGRKNYIINGNFDIWQRGTSQTNAGYASDDRWSNYHNGSTKTHSQQEFTLGQTDVPNEPKYFSRTVVTSVAGVYNYCFKIQRLESVRSLAGKTATLSFYAKADAAKNIAVELTQQFGTDGSPSEAITGIEVTTCVLTTSWQKFTITVNLPSIAGKTLGTNNDDSLELLFWFDAGSYYNARTNSLGQQSGTFDIAQVQLEEGSVATNFEYRPIGEELALCQRYYHTLYIDERTITDVGYTVRTYPISPNMRTAPSLTFADLLGTTDYIMNDTIGRVNTLTRRTTPQAYGGWYWSATTVKMDAEL